MPTHLPHCQDTCWGVGKPSSSPGPEGQSGLLIPFPWPWFGLGRVVEHTFGSLNMRSLLGAPLKGVPILKRDPRQGRVLFLPSFSLGAALWVHRAFVNKPEGKGKTYFEVAKQKAKTGSRLSRSCRTHQSWNQRTTQSCTDSLSVKIIIPLLFEPL